MRQFIELILYSRIADFTRYMRVGYVYMMASKGITKVSISKWFVRPCRLDIIKNIQRNCPKKTFWMELKRAIKIYSLWIWLTQTKSIHTIVGIGRIQRYDLQGSVQFQNFFLKYPIDINVSLFKGVPNYTELDCFEHL